MLLPKQKHLDGIIIEFKVYNPRREKTLQDTAANALRQIEQKGYARELLESGLPENRIRELRFCFSRERSVY